MATPPTGRYPEIWIQRSAVAWLTENRGYAEAYSDEHGDMHARFDSVGVMDSRLVLIEVKPSVGFSLVDHHQDRPQSLEAKVSGGLRGIYANDGSPLAKAAGRVWRDRNVPPLVVILAGNFSPDGLESTVAMLTRRASEWRFDFAAWRWTGNAVEVLHEGACDVAACISSAIEVPKLIGRGYRAPNRTLPELMKLADDRGVGAVFSALIEFARSNDLHFVRYRGSINFQRFAASSGRRETLFGAYIESSTPNGLVFGINREVISIRDADLPGTPSPSPVGYLNTERLLRGPDDIEQLAGLFPPKS